jgi:D-glycerate 3-kinase
MNTLIPEFMAAHRLPESFEAVAREAYMPLAERVAHWHGAGGEPLGLALNGGQGTGKSTLGAFLRDYLQRFYGLRVFVLSLDDLYLTRVEREALGARVHPLLATRGVPGTHDLGIGMDVASACLNHESKTIESPLFKKENDDRAPRAEWHRLTAPVDVLILEGWCVGAIPEPEVALEEPLNELEREADADGVWRTYVNQKLKMEYQKFFSLFPRRVLLKAPGFDCILRWRSKQERKLRETLEVSGGGHAGLMDDAGVARFIMHYERLTRWMLAEMPARVDACIHLNETHGVERLMLQDDG